MSSIGPQLPPHLGKGNGDELPAEEEEQEEEYGPAPPSTKAAGPALPPKVDRPSLPSAAGPSRPQDEEDEDEEDAYLPALPPDLASKPKRTLGPTMPTRGPSSSRPPAPSYNDDSSDEEVGPMPAPASASTTYDPVQEFMDREERRKKAQEDASKPQKLQREEWMLVPPTSSGLLGSLDPTKLKARQFSRSTRPSAPSSEVSLWTETPEQKQARLKDEVEGKRKRATDVEEEVDEGSKKRSRREAEVSAQIEAYNRQTRGQTLVELHQSAKAKEPDEKDDKIWDHARDMSLGGRLMDGKQRDKMLQDARTLGDRFGKGKSGFL